MPISIWPGLDWVKANFYNAAESLNIRDVVCMKQPHFTDVLWVEKTQKEWLDCDALLTDKKGVRLAVRTADCAPILLVDTQKHIVGAIHAGWKGALQGIIEQTVHQMQLRGCLLSDIVAAIGPHLQKDSFAVSYEMKSLFPPIHHHFFTEEKGKILFDFDAYVQMRLKHVGIKRITSNGTDTFPCVDYNSYRRDPENPARQLSVIEIV